MCIYVEERKFINVLFHSKGMDMGTYHPCSIIKNDVNNPPQRVSYTGTIAHKIFHHKKVVSDTGISVGTSMMTSS